MLNVIRTFAIMNQHGEEERVNLTDTFICFDLLFSPPNSDPVTYFCLQVTVFICENATEASLFSIIMVTFPDNPLLWDRGNRRFLVLENMNSAIIIEYFSPLCVLSLPCTSIKTSAPFSYSKWYQKRIKLYLNKVFILNQ